MSFEDLNIEQALASRLRKAGFVKPTGIQSQAIPTVLSGRDLIGLAPPGTGKTLAFIAPIVQCMMSESKTGVRALVLTPTRELAEQVASDARTASHGTAVRVICAHGGTGAPPQSDAPETDTAAALLVATPGRMLELLDQSHVTLAFLEHVVLDEADRLMDMGFAPQIESILKRCPGERQTVLFSATMPREVERLASAHLHHPVRIETCDRSAMVAHVPQRLLGVREDAKFDVLRRLIVDEGRSGVLVFARTKRRVGWVAAALARHGVRAAAMHGDRSQAQRRRALEGFRQGDFAVIVATDVAARGLHIDSVRTVINYDLPPDGEEYLHRVGRAGHGSAIEGGPFEAAGEAFTLLDPRDRDEWSRISGAAEVSLQPERISVARDSAAPSRGAAAKAPRRAPAPRGGGHGPREKTPTAARGGSKRRRGASRPIRRGEKPGGGVRGES